jgi:hypothetical protein
MEIVEWVYASSFLDPKDRFLKPVTWLNNATMRLDGLDLAK